MIAPTDTIPYKLAIKATDAVARARRENPPGVDALGMLIWASTVIRREWQDTDGPKPSLRDVRDAVQACMNRQVTMADLEQYRQPVPNPIKGWSWRFPNGRFASVIPDHRSPARFELLSSDRSDGPHGDGLSTGLSTVEVEALLIDIATRPR